MTKKQTGEERVYLVYISISLRVIKEAGTGQKLKQGRNLEAGTDAEAMEGSCLSASPDLHSLFSCRTQDHQPRDEHTQIGLGPPHLS